MFGVTTPCVQAVVEAARGDELRLPRLPRHRRRRPVDGEARRLGPARRRDRRHDDRDRRRDRRRRAVGRADAGSTSSRARPLPYVGSCGALDMVNFGAWDTVPERFQGRKLYRHNADGDADAHDGRRECRAIGALHRRQAQRDDRPGALPHPRRRRLGDRPPGQPFHDPEADRGAVRRDRASASAPAPTASSSACRCTSTTTAFAEALVDGLARSCAIAASANVIRRERRHAPHR